MRDNRIGPLVIGLAILSAAPTAAAQTKALEDSPDVAEHAQNVWTTRPLALAVHAAPLVGSPTGQLGGSIDYSPTTWVSAWVGAGLGGGEVFAPQLAAMVRLRALLSDLHGLAIGGGISGGEYTPILQGLWGEGEYTERTWRPAIWANGEVSLEIRPSFGLTVRPFLGVSVLMNEDAVKCVEYHDGEPSGPAKTCTYKPDRDDKRLPYAGVAVGYAFRL